MKIALVAMVAALAAIGFTAPAYAGDNDNSGVQLTLAASFPFAPELLAQAVAAARTQADIEASAVEKLKSGVKWTDLPLEERIAVRPTTAAA